MCDEEIKERTELGKAPVIVWSLMNFGSVMQVIYSPDNVRLERGPVAQRVDVFLEGTISLNTSRNIQF